MTANVSLNQFVCLKQPACDYLSQCYQISAHIKNLIEELKAFPGLQFDVLIKALEKFLESFQIGVEESHCALDDNVIPYFSLLSLNVCQKQGLNLLREAANDLNKLKHILLEAADDLDTYDSFELDSKKSAIVLSKKNGSKEVAHG